MVTMSMMHGNPTVIPPEQPDWAWVIGDAISLQLSEQGKTLADFPDHTRIAEIFADGTWPLDDWLWVLGRLGLDPAKTMTLTWEMKP